MSKDDDVVFVLEAPIVGDWVTLDRNHAGVLTARLAETGFLGDGLIQIDAVRLLPLDFYSGWVLCDVQTSRKSAVMDEDSRPGGREKGPKQALGRFPDSGIHSFLYGPDGFTALDGTSPPIHEHNQCHGVDLSDEPRREAYLKFFCFFVRGELSPFEVLDDARRLVYPVGGEAEVNSSPAITPPASLAATGELAGRLRAHVLYGRTLFEASFEIHRSGFIDMTDDKLIADGVGRVPDLGFIKTMRYPLTASNPHE
ncbi:hypothetical protein ACLMJV_25340 [Sinorhizobium meliloti]|uniref:hypothetical protein n=1 Tax=Rhizobium meliloti TaxID=382 RepID=UPI00398D6598